MANPIGAGPYAVESWSPGAELVLTRNEHYHDPERPYIDRIVITETSDVNQRMIAYEANNAQLILVPPDQVPSVDASELVFAPHHLMTFLGFNTTAPPFDDVRVRRAIALAIDTDSLVALGNGTYEKGNGGIPPNIAGWAPPSQPYYSRDVDAAAALLAEAGAEGISVELTYDSGLVNHDLVAQVIQASLADIGIDVTIQALDTTSHIERTSSLEYEMDLWTMSAISPTAADPIGYYLAVSYLFTGFPMDVLEAGYLDFTGTTDPAAQDAAITMVQDEIFNEAPFVGLTNQQTAFAVKPSVHGFAPAPWATWWYDTIWLEQ